MLSVLFRNSHLCQFCSDIQSVVSSILLVIQLSVLFWYSSCSQLHSNIYSVVSFLLIFIPLSVLLEFILLFWFSLLTRLSSVVHPIRQLYSDIHSFESQFYSQVFPVVSSIWFILHRQLYSDVYSFVISIRVFIQFSIQFYSFSFSDFYSFVSSLLIFISWSVEFWFSLICQLNSDIYSALSSSPIANYSVVSSIPLSGLFGYFLVFSFTLIVPIW